MAQTHSRHGQRPLHAPNLPSGAKSDLSLRPSCPGGEWVHRGELLRSVGGLPMRIFQPDKFWDARTDQLDRSGTKNPDLKNSTPPTPVPHPLLPEPEPRHVTPKLPCLHGRVDRLPWTQGHAPGPSGSAGWPPGHMGGAGWPDATSELGVGWGGGGPSSGLSMFSLLVWPVYVSWGVLAATGPAPKASHAPSTFFIGFDHRGTPHRGCVGVDWLRRRRRRRRSGRKLHPGQFDRSHESRATACSSR